MKKEICEYQDCKYPGKPFSSKNDRYRRITHHIDENHYNDDPKNLMIIHHGCHARLHGRNKIGDKNPMYGKCFSEETRKRMSESGKKAWDNEQRRKNTSDFMKTRIGDKNPNYGKHLSEEHKKKISKAVTNPSTETRRKMSLASSSRRSSKETIARRSFSRKIGKENYSEIKDDLFWDGSALINMSEVMSSECKIEEKKQFY